MGAVTQILKLGKTKGNGFLCRADSVFDLLFLQDSAVVDRMWTLNKRSGEQTSLEKVKKIVQGHKLSKKQSKDSNLILIPNS